MSGFCVALNVSLSKIGGDIAAMTTDSLPPKKIVVCTARSLSKQKITEWQIKLKTKYAIDVVIFERTWVVDECMRPENAFLVSAELQIARIHDQDGIRIDASSTAFISSRSSYAGTIGVSGNHDTWYVAWYEPPALDKTEKVAITRMINDEFVESDTIYISDRADPHILVLKNEVLLASINRTQTIDGSDVWEIFLDVFDMDLNHINSKSVAKNLNLCQSPQLIVHYSEVLLFAVTEEPGNLYLYNVTLGKQDVFDLLTNYPSSFKAESLSKELYCAICIENTIVLLRRSNNNWIRVSEINQKILGTKRIGRFAWLPGNPHLFVIETFVSDFTLYSVVIDPSTGRVGNLWPLSYHGKFPSIAKVGHNIVAAWVGSPPLPLPLQGRELVDSGAELYRMALEEVRKITGKYLRQLSEVGLGESEAEDDSSWGPQFIHPWAPLWISHLNSQGHALKTSDLMGYYAGENIETSLCSCGDKGLLIWKISAPTECDDEQAVIAFRSFSLSC